MSDNFLNFLNLLTLILLSLNIRTGSRRERQRRSVADRQYEQNPVGDPVSQTGWESEKGLHPCDRLGPIHKGLNQQSPFSK
jgi:hypothetical protein